MYEKRPSPGVARLLSSQNADSLPAKQRTNAASGSIQRSSLRQVRPSASLGRGRVLPVGIAEARPADAGPDTWSTRRTGWRSTIARKFSSSRRPCSLPIDSGWNCTPHSGRSRWRTPMTTPSSVQAIASRLSGSAGSTTSEW